MEIHNVAKIWAYMAILTTLVYPAFFLWAKIRSKLHANSKWPIFGRSKSTFWPFFRTFANLGLFWLHLDHRVLRLFDVLPSFVEGRAAIFGQQFGLAGGAGKIWA